jgi:hypothetical protein
MRASRAYIASIGTTSVLIASSVMLLIVVSTIVAFRGWPGDDIANGLESLVVDKDRPSLDVSGPTQLAADAAPAAGAVAGAPAPGSPAAKALATDEASGRADAPRSRVLGGLRSVPPAAGGPAPTALPPASGDGAAPPSPPDSATGGLGDTTEEVTRDLGDSFGQTSPQLGETVTDTGQALSDLVQQLGTGLGQ